MGPGIAITPLDEIERLRSPRTRFQNVCPMSSKTFGVFNTMLTLNPAVSHHGRMSATTFGKLFALPVDGYVYAQPLYVAGVAIPGQGTHNVVYVATEHDSLYAFDADGKSSTPLWKDSFINPSAGVNPIPPAVTGETQDIPNEIGITGTPVIDQATNTMYVVA